MAVEQADVLVRLQCLFEECRKFLRTDNLALCLIDRVVDDIEHSRQDDAKQAVAADHMGEYVGIFSARAGNDAAVGEHDPHRPDASGDGTRLVVHAVGIDRNRSADGKDVGRLHCLDGEAWVQFVLNGMPGRTGLHADGFGLGIELDFVELAHVEHQSIVVEGVAAH
jgi:hypothetical protein